MKDKAKKKRVSTDDLSKAIERKRWQITFRNYPKHRQDILTRLGLNPFENRKEDRIEYREFTVDTKEN